MEIEQLKKLLELLVKEPKETERLEFKENNHEKDEIGQLISGLSNAANIHTKSFGYLVFGVKDDTHEIVGTNFKPKSEKIGNEELENWIMQMLNPRIDIRIYEFQYNEKNIVIFEIPATLDRPVSFRLIEYVRVGSINRKLSDFPDKEKKIWHNLKNNSFEKEIAKTYVNSDDILKLLDYSAYFSLTDQPLPDNKQGILDKLCQEKFLIKTDSGYNITNLGAILFATDLKNFDTTKRKGLRVIIYKGKDRIETIKEQEGNKGYAVGLKGIIDYINDKLPSNEEIQKTFRIEKKMYPEIAIRELVVNTLIHQDFNERGVGPMVEIFEDRIEITNPGKPLIDTNRFIDHAPKSRNEDLAGFMRRIRACEERGSGIDKVISSIEFFQLPAPKFESGEDYTKATLYSYRPLNKMDKNDKIRACYQHCCLKYVSNSFMTNTTLRERFSIDVDNYPMASKIISDTIMAGFIKINDPENKSKKHAKYIPIWA